MYAHVCPVCGVKFYPTPQHVYKTSQWSRGSKFICSWGCLVKYRKEQEQKNKKRRRKKVHED